MPAPAAYIFDMDGTMIDSMPYHLEAWQHLLSSLGLDLPKEEIQKQLYGTNPEVLCRFFGEGRFTEDEMLQYGNYKEALYRERYATDLQLVAGLPEFLEASHQAGILMAIGTSGTPENVDFVLDGCHIRHYFSAVVTADDVVQGKPHPETFLKCAEKMGVLPTSCVVFEDVPKGAEAAKHANMPVIVVMTHHQPDEFEGMPVLQFVNDFSEVIFVSKNVETRPVVQK